MKILNITFDTRVKILVVICVIIALTIISYSFYYICIRENKEEIQPQKIENIEEILDVLCYEAKYDVTVNANKTTNTYNVAENVDLENNTYNMVIDETLTISINSNNTSVKRQNMEYEYFTTTGEILKNNAISFSSIIECIKKISNKEIKGNIKRIEQDDKFIYQISTDENYIEKVKRIEITTQKENCKITEIKMYNSEENELYSMIFESFMVKK